MQVVLVTTLGELEIELWSKECPKACRNFIQLCLEGYYDNTIFHNVVPNFIAQGGDPSGIVPTLNLTLSNCNHSLFKFNQVLGMGVKAFMENHTRYDDI